MLSYNILFQFDPHLVDPFIDLLDLLAVFLHQIIADFHGKHHKLSVLFFQLLFHFQKCCAALFQLFVTFLDQLSVFFPGSALRLFFSFHGRKYFLHQLVFQAFDILLPGLPCSLLFQKLIYFFFFSFDLSTDTGLCKKAVPLLIQCQDRYLFAIDCLHIFIVFACQMTTFFFPVIMILNCSLYYKTASSGCPTDVHFLPARCPVHPDPDGRNSRSP